MKMAFDIHGTIGMFPIIFKPIMRAYVESGMDVCIISGPSEVQIRKELIDLGYDEGIHFNGEVYSVVDFIKYKTDVKMEQYENDSWYCEDKFWWASKGLMCDIYNIDMITDNDIRYKANIPLSTMFIHWNFKKD